LVVDHLLFAGHVKFLQQQAYFIGLARQPKPNLDPGPGFLFIDGYKDFRCHPEMLFLFSGLRLLFSRISFHASIYRSCLAFPGFRISSCLLYFLLVVTPKISPNFFSCFPGNPF
jgi:hypothetical protein